MNPKNDAMTIGATSVRIKARLSVTKSCKSLRISPTKAINIVILVAQLTPGQRKKNGFQVGLLASNLRDASVECCNGLIGDDASVIHDDDSIGKTFYLFHVVRRVEDGLAALLQNFQVIENSVAALRIDADR